MANKMTREDYREKQKKYRELAKSSGSWLHISKLPMRELLGKPHYEQKGLIKGRTYKKEGAKNDVVK